MPDRQLSALAMLHTPTARKSRTAKLTAALALAAMILTSCADTKTAAPAPEDNFSALTEYQKQKLAWSGCYDEFECAELRVPIDYDNLDLGTFRISVLRATANDPKNRLGSIVVNPGGPGGSGVDYAFNAEYIFSPDITDVYDIVGFDPRGVAQSEPIYCYSDAEIDSSYAADSKPDNDAEVTESLAESENFATKCAEGTDNLAHFTTTEAARDMDILRSALGEEKLNYLGKSYGTFMGTLYAEMFPDKVGRFILDGAVDPNISMKDQNIAQAVGFDGAVEAFITACLTLSDCPFTGDLKSAQKSITATLQSAASSPLPQKNPADGDDRLATESILVIGMASSLYDNVDGWPKLRRAFTEAKLNYGDTFIQLADEYAGRNPDGTFMSNDFDSGAVIDCLDWPDTRSTDEYRKDAQEFAAKAPIFGPYIAYAGMHCKYLPEPKTQRAPGSFTTITTAPVIVIGTTRDPATPYAWSQNLAKLFSGSRLITLDADGHTGQGRGSFCVDDAVDAFLLTGTLPKPKLRCTLDQLETRL